MIAAAVKPCGAHTSRPVSADRFPHSARTPSRKTSKSSESARARNFALAAQQYQFTFLRHADNWCDPPISAVSYLAVV